MKILRLLRVELEGEAESLALWIRFADGDFKDLEVAAKKGQRVDMDVGYIIRESFALAYKKDGEFEPFYEKVAIGDDASFVDLDCDHVSIDKITSGEMVETAMVDTQGNTLKVRYRVDVWPVMFAPPLQLRPRSKPKPVPAAVSLSSSSSGSGSGSNKIQENRTCCYIAQPTNYTGDKWHIGAALVLNPNYRVIILQKNQKKDEKGLAAGYTEFYKKLGVEEERILRGAAKSKMRQIAPSYWPTRADEVAKKDADKAARIVRMTFASTSGILSAVEDRGVARVREDLQTAFLKTFTNAPARKKIEARIAFLQKLGPCVIVNMRNSHYHFEHNITEKIYDQIESAAKALGFMVIRAGIFEPEKRENEKDKAFAARYKHGAWMKGRFKDDYAKKPAGQQFIDIFGYREERTAAKADEQETAYLWSLVAKLKNVRGVIGGRSGSLDIAAFMGVRTLSWDIVDEDAEYFRMLLAYPLMSCCRRAGIEEEGRPGTEDEPSGELNKGLLEPLALALWLQGREVIPEHGPSNPLPRKVVEKELEFEPLHYLDWMLDSKRGAGDEQAASAEAADGDDMADDDDKTDDDEEIHERKSEKKSDDDKAKKAKVADDGQKAEKGK